MRFIFNILIKKSLLTASFIFTLKKIKKNSIFINFELYIQIL